MSERELSNVIFNDYIDQGERLLKMYTALLNDKEFEKRKLGQEYLLLRQLSMFIKKILQSRQTTPNYAFDQAKLIKKRLENLSETRLAKQLPKTLIKIYARQYFLTLISMLRKDQGTFEEWNKNRVVAGSRFMGTKWVQNFLENCKKIGDKNAVEQAEKIAGELNKSPSPLLLAQNIVKQVRKWEKDIRHFYGQVMHDLDKIEKRKLKLRDRVLGMVSDRIDLSNACQIIYESARAETNRILEISTAIQELTKWLFEVYELIQERIKVYQEEGITADEHLLNQLKKVCGNVDKVKEKLESKFDDAEKTKAGIIQIIDNVRELEKVVEAQREEAGSYEALKQFSDKAA